MSIGIRSILLFSMLAVSCGPGNRSESPRPPAAVADGDAAPGEVTTPPAPPPSQPPAPPKEPVRANLHFDRVFIIVMENESAPVIQSHPYYQNLASRGARFSDAHGVARPSYPNYLAMIAGDTFGVADSVQRTLAGPTIADLLGAKGLSWKNYVEDYPGGCFLGDTFGRNARKHAPFLSFQNVTSRPAECAKVVGQAGFTADRSAGTVPAYAMYSPDLDHDGHDTGYAFGASWLQGFLEPLLADAGFMKGTLVVVTFDEANHQDASNHIYTVFLGSMVQAGKVVTTYYDHYTLLRTIEENFALGTLGRRDQNAIPITGIWK